MIVSWPDNFSLPEPAAIRLKEKRHVGGRQEEKKQRAEFCCV
jgi:hypothetical protein